MRRVAALGVISAAALMFAGGISAGSPSAASDQYTSDIIKVDGLYYVRIGAEKDAVKLVDPINHMVSRPDTWSGYHNEDFDIPERVEFDGVGYPVRAVERLTFHSPITKSIKFPQSIRLIESNCCGNNKIETLQFSEGLEMIMDVSFGSLPYLESVEFPSTLYSIGSRCFNETKLSTIKFSEGLSMIGAESFCDNSDLEEIVLPSSLEYIGDGAFSNNANLKRVVINSNPSIGSDAFSNCPSLQEIYLNSEYVTKWRQYTNAFDVPDKTKVTIVVPDGCRDKAWGFQGFNVVERSEYTGVSNIENDNSSEKVYSLDGKKLNKSAAAAGASLRKSNDGKNVVLIR